ncbi:four-carbon acid sugar kinase family protein [Rhizobium terrae]|uniref:four-carbon acid sugar kinase family protein n=1 Tax=Rhizobium terrae TaxID=2171756 RepID=UPI0029C0E976|nr:four-carbon acid sugar kinase family protein [Rhizobium terrae]
MSTLLGVIADDITGASDIAALLARSGRQVTLRFGVPQEPSGNSAAIEVVALKIRTIPVNEAIIEARAALRWLQQAGARRFFWKYCSTFDSTAQGNIGPVAEALMTDLGTQQTIYCPAFPENGRTVYMGNLFIGRQPLAESPMKDHLLTPMRDSNLVRLLQQQGSGRVGLVDRLTTMRGPDHITAALSALHRDGHNHAIIDAIDDNDLTACWTTRQRPRQDRASPTLRSFCREAARR